MVSVHTRPEEFENRGFTLKKRQMVSVHTRPEEFENRGFTLKKRQMVSVHTRPEEFENRGFTLKKRQIVFAVHNYLQWRNLKTQQTITGHVGCWEST